MSNLHRRSPLIATLMSTIIALVGLRVCGASGQDQTQNENTQGQRQDETTRQQAASAGSWVAVRQRVA